MVVWGATLAIYMVAKWPTINKRSYYGVWYTLLLATIFISLAFDLNDARKVLVEIAENAA